MKAKHSVSGKPVVIFDVDNTLYNFVDFFGPAFRAMLHTISLHTGIDEALIIQSFREVYKRRGSLEYRFSIQELDILRNLDDEKMDRVKHAAIVAFSRSRKRRLLPYSGVPETLRWLKETGYGLIAYTDAPHIHSLNRLRKLGIKVYFDMLIAWGPTLDENDQPNIADDKLQMWYTRGDDTAYQVGDLIILTHPASERKPNRALLERIIEEVRIIPTRSWVVGDSVEKDLLPAKDFGFTEIWARYGKSFQRKNWETLVGISPWEQREIQREVKGQGNIEPSYVIDEFSELQQIIPAIQVSLF